MLFACEQFKGRPQKQQLGACLLQKCRTNAWPLRETPMSTKGWTATNLLISSKITFSRVERFQKNCSHSREKKTERSFWILASAFAKATADRSFRLSHRVFQTCSFAEASPEPKNPRSEWLQLFFKRSRKSFLSKTPLFLQKFLVC